MKYIYMTVKSVRVLCVSLFVVTVKRNERKRNLKKGRCIGNIPYNLMFPSVSPKEFFATHLKIPKSV
jgi:hypothetical protein